ncbi:MAG TPA: decaprenyl-phosphate phosphoribosyltransferase [Phycisphaerae bacterium]|nr:decaprenyl-phosphate phosphoribosyltransferase [Phycisphaerae bacterium]
MQTLFASIRLLRPAQWIKNVFVLAALVFGVRPTSPNAVDALIAALEALAIFCMLSSSVYAFNDLMDYREDALHPTKKHRPVASGAISPTLAGIIAVALATIGSFGALRIGAGFALTAVSYLLLNLFYSLAGKRMVLLDVIIIAIGFVLRALAGAQAINVPVSAWLVVCTFTLCLFLGFGKRRCELAVLEAGGKASKHRATLASYTPEILSQFLAVSGAMAVITFLLYTLDGSNPTPRTLVFTTPLVLFSIFRYALVITRGQLTGPTDVLIRDRPFLVTAVLWVVVTMLLIAFDTQISPYLPALRYPYEQRATTQSVTAPADAIP